MQGSRALERWWFAHSAPAQYNASWAVVTGGSGGIGKAICVRLARQGINVVVAALDDKLLAETVAELRAAHPQLSIRSCPVDMGKPGYVDAIKEATKVCCWLFLKPRSLAPGHSCVAAVQQRRLYGTVCEKPPPRAHRSLLTH